MTFSPNKLLDRYVSNLYSPSCLSHYNMCLSPPSSIIHYVTSAQGEDIYIMLNALVQSSTNQVFIKLSSVSHACWGRSRGSDGHGRGSKHTLGRPWGASVTGSGRRAPQGPDARAARQLGITIIGTREATGVRSLTLTPRSLSDTRPTLK